MAQNWIGHQSRRSDRKGRRPTRRTRAVAADSSYSKGRPRMDRTSNWANRPDRTSVRTQVTQTLLKSVFPPTSRAPFGGASSSIFHGLQGGGSLEVSSPRLDRTSIKGVDRIGRRTIEKTRTEAAALLTPIGGGGCPEWIGRHAGHLTE
jgi:hypothetical protein